MNTTRLLRLTQAVGLLTVGAVFGYSGQAPASHEARPDNVASCEGGTQSPLQMALQPMAVKQTKTGEALVLSLELHSRFSEKAHAQVAVQLVDDRGREAMKPVISDRLILRPGVEGMQSFELATPADLKDGYYTLLATGALLNSDGQSAENLVQMYLHRERGEFSTLTYEEYVTSSHALLEVAEK